MNLETTGTRVMIVDDDPFELDLLQNYLNGQPYRTFLFKSGKAALNAVDKVIPDLILLDILMPEMDGFEVCRRIRNDERLHQVPVIFTSALPEDGNRLRAVVLGAVDYVMKPIQQDRLLTRIKIHLALAALHHRKKEVGP
ncbi:MAG: response regulator [Desulfotignum sp.]|nr:response regulator [Desulfotignum sp.]MCF8137531.1 response regulator [Desulfotignum sp.]